MWLVCESFRERRVRKKTCEKDVERGADGGRPEELEEMEEDLGRQEKGSFTAGKDSGKSELRFRSNVRREEDSSDDEDGRRKRN